jgi:hypothetical protein
MLEFEEFKQNLCIRCGKCTDYQLKRVTSTFCFEAYKKNSALFMTYSYQRLRNLTSWPLYIKKEEDCFENIFCKSKVCGKLKGQRCHNFNFCLDNFTATLNSYIIKVINFDDLPFKIKIETPSIIFGGSIDWINTVKKME